MTLKATVQNGRLILDQPTKLPEGTVLELVIDDGGEDMSQEEIDALNAAISKSWAEAEAGQLTPANEVLRRLREQNGS